MNSWIDNGALALIFGGAFFLLIFVPGLLWQFRRFGGFSFRRMLGLAAVCLYATALYTYTFLPLPERSQAWCDANAAGANFRPFHFIEEIRARTVGLNLVQTLKSFAFLQVVFNVLLFVPLGMILRRYFHVSAWLSILAGAFVSFLIEATQYTGLWYLYPCAYRVADVDDLLLNTAGTAFGVLLAPAALFWMPSARVLRGKRMTPRRVTTLRRWLGMMIDLTLMVAITLLLEVGIIITKRFITGTIFSKPDVPFTLAFIVAWGLVFLLPAWQGTGSSIGQMTVWLVPKWREDGRWTDGTRKQRLAHASVVPGICAALLVNNVLFDVGFTQLSLVLVFMAFVMVPFTRSKRGLSGWLTGAEMRDSRESDQVASEPAKALG